MMLRNKMWGLAVAGLFAMTSVSTAAAQDPEAGATGTWQQPAQPQPGGWQAQPQQQQPPPQGGGWQQPAPQGGQAGWNNAPPNGGDHEAPPTGGDATPAASTSDSDHTAAVGHIGVGWFGVGGLTLGLDFPGATRATTLTVSAPAVGVRYWLNDTIGLDAALGFGYTSTGGSVENPDGTGSDDPGTSGFALTVHGGLPISVYHGEHYSFQIVPEVDLAFGSGTIYGTTANDDLLLSAFAFKIGARAGAEIHFGFIGVPQLALQATIGLALGYQSSSLELTLSPDGTTIVTANGLVFSTTVQDEPWDIFTGSLRAIYYWE